MSERVVLPVLHEEELSRPLVLELPPESEDMSQNPPAPQIENLSEQRRAFEIRQRTAVKAEYDKVQARLNELMADNAKRLAELKGEENE